MRRRLISLLFATGCASAGAPPGGPERHTPPEIVSITPDSGQRNVTVKEVQFHFDEVVSDRASSQGGMLDQIFLVSPRTGAPEVSWHRRYISVRPRGGFRPNTAYTVTLLPGLIDLRGNVRKTAKTIAFSTGATFPSFTIPGRVFDWAGQRAAPGAYIEATSNADTTVVYLAVSDSSGQFDVGPLPSGSYLVRALIDQNNNRALDRNEKWDTLTVDITNVRTYKELNAIERDSTPAVFDAITLIDSVTLRVPFDKPLDPTLQVQPALIRITRPDSSVVEVTRVQWASAYDQARSAQLADSMRRVDSVRNAGRPVTPGAPPITVPTPGGPRNAPPPPKPSKPAPDRAVIVSVATLLAPGQYLATGRGFRNLLGKSADIRRSFTVPKPAPRDTTTRRPPAPGDSARPPSRPPPR